MRGTGEQVTEQERAQALVTALTTEHFVLQTSRAATVAESVGRATVFLSTLSAGLIGLGFVAGKGAVAAAYLAAVMPTLLVVGWLTFVRLTQTTVENAVDLQRIRRIRAYYHEQFEPDGRFFADAVAPGDDARVAWAATGVPPSRFAMLYTAAAMVAAINSLLAGTSVALLLALAETVLVTDIAVGVVVAVLAFVAQIRFQSRVMSRLPEPRA